MPTESDLQSTPAGLSIEKETGRAMQDHREDMMQLPDSRLRLEAEAIFGYGSAAASMRLLWRYKLLDVLLPHLAQRFAKAKLPRCASMLITCGDWSVSLLPRLTCRLFTP